MEIFLSNYIIIYYLYSTDLPGWVDVIKFIFELYPPFNFSKAFSDISNKAASHFDSYALKWVPGEKYEWKDLFKRTAGSIKGGVDYDVPSTFTTVLYFFMDILVFGVLTWYFDHIDSSNRGKSYDKLFFLKKSYWTGKSNASDQYENNEEIRELRTRLQTSESGNFILI
jgi:hypothetical protein